ncbi:hypothetical protein I4U23_027296 [Adineta vaga]|nr:hypothetical protein I4U23_027296 [Adineta vaga]
MKGFITRPGLRDWYNYAPSYFQLLTDLCRMANKTVEDAISRLRLKQFAVSNVPTETTFTLQINDILDQFILSTMKSFQVFINTTRLFIQVDQPYMKWALSTNSDLVDTNLIVGYSRENEINNKTSLKLEFELIEIHDLKSSLDNYKLPIQPLLYNSTISRFRPDTLIISIAEKLMIEQWNPFSTYENFYQLCEPEYCTYLKRTRTKDTLEPTRSSKGRPKKRCAPLLRCRIDRITVKRLGQWSTRLYIILFITSLVILTLYTIIRPESQTKMFEKPSIDHYNHLIQKYGNHLKCFCSSIALKHNEFVILKPQFHQICSSPFASDQWRTNVTSGLVNNLLSYPLKDYRRFLSAHLQFLHGLCELSFESINNSVHQFHTSLFITTQLLSEIELDQRLNSTIEQIQSNTLQTLTQFLFLIRKINHADGVISTYGTNYEYIIPWDKFDGVYAPTKARTYDNCSCDLDLNCTSQAIFYSRSEKIPIKGLKIGCTPIWDHFRHRIDLVIGSGTEFHGRAMKDMVELIWMSDIVVADFNHDTWPDLAISSIDSSDIRLLSGYGTGCCHIYKTFEIKKTMNLFKLATADFNCDDVLDIVFSESNPFRIQTLVGSRSGNYHLEEVLTEESNSTYIWIDVGDLNGDNYPDIIAFDQSFGFIFILLNTNKCCLYKYR